MRRSLALILLVHVLSLAGCGKIAVGGGPEGGGYMERKKESGAMTMVTIVVAAAAVIGLLYIREQAKKPD